MLTHGSLFSGIGAFDLSFERVGIPTLWMVEKEPTCQQVLRRHFTGDIYDDVITVSGDALSPVDVITFGSPCQDLSIAGKRAGMEGERSGLFFEAIRIIREMREATNDRYPTYAIWENVPGALSSAKGSDFTGVLDALANIGALDIGWRILNAQYFGVPQRRRRVYVVADFTGRRAGEILFEPESVCGNTATGKKAGQVIATLPACGAGTSRPGGGESEVGFLISMALNAKSTGRYDASVETLITSPLTTDAYADQIAEESKLIPVCFDARNNSVNAMPLCFESRFARNGRGAPSEIVPPLKAESGGTGKGDGAPLVFEHQASVANGMSVSEDSFSSLKKSTTPAVFRITFNDANGTRSDRPNGGCYVSEVEKTGALTLADNDVKVLQKGVRRITPTEAERLQGFPDDWTKTGIDNGKEVTLSDSARYRMLGNAVCVNVAEWIAHRIAKQQCWHGLNSRAAEAPTLRWQENWEGT